MHNAAAATPGTMKDTSDRRKRTAQPMATLDCSPADLDQSPHRPGTSPPVWISFSSQCAPEVIAAAEDDAAHPGDATADGIGEP
jgi:hypothetical protein